MQISVNQNILSLFMFSEARFIFMFTGLMSFGNPP